MEKIKNNDSKNSFDTQKFEVERDSKKLSLSKEEYSKWFNDQIKSQDEKTERQKTFAKRFAIIFTSSFVALVFILTIILVTVL